MSRLISGTAFVAAALAFALPFGAVSSCSGEEVRFTGVELVTVDVAPDGSHGGRLDRTVERNGSVLAGCALVAALVGLALTIASRSGVGVCALLGLVATQLLGLAILVSSDGPIDLLVGYWLALASMCVAGAVSLVTGVRVRRTASARPWRWALGRVTLALAPLLLVLALLVVVGVSVLLE